MVLDGVARGCLGGKTSRWTWRVISKIKKGRQFGLINTADVYSLPLGWKIMCLSIQCIHWRDCLSAYNGSVDVISHEGIVGPHPLWRDCNIIKTVINLMISHVIEDSIVNLGKRQGK
jgi:hypothetical protein